MRTQRAMRSTARASRWPLSPAAMELRNRRAMTRQSASSRLYYEHDANARGLAAWALSHAAYLRSVGLPIAARRAVALSREMRDGSYFRDGLRLERFAAWVVLP